MVAVPEPFGEQLRERSAQSEIENAEVTHDQPDERQYPEPFRAQSANENRDGEQCGDRGHDLPEQIPGGIASKHRHSAVARPGPIRPASPSRYPSTQARAKAVRPCIVRTTTLAAVSYTHLRAHETPEHLVC